MLTANAKILPMPMACRALMLLAIVSVSSQAYQAPSPFLASRIDSALCVRDFYYKTFFHDTLNFSITSLNKIQQSEMCERLFAFPADSGNPWHNFFWGILECNQKKADPSGYFATALTLAQQDPGTTWALFVEFTRNQKAMWAERCLLHLEKLLLASGAQSAPVIAQQLLFYASLSEKQNDYKSAFSYYRWAERFDRNQPWSLLHRLWKCLPSHPQLFFTTLDEMMKLGYHSWVLQLHCAAHIYTWIRYFLIIFVLIVFTGVGLRYLPPAIHPIADRLPEETPAPLKTLLPICMILAFISFGVIPFLWLILFLTWRFAEKKEKVIVAFALLVLLCAPIDARIQDMFRQAQMPQSSISLYIRASEEGYSPELHQQALEKVVTNSSDFIAFITASLCALKKGDTAAACLSANRALSLRPDDPAVLLQAGNAAYVANDFKTSATYYQNILRKYPSQMDARFNLAQCYARKSDTVIDLDFIKVLSAGDLSFINNFTNTNDMYFSKNWPVLRQFIPLSLTTAYFWKNIFPAHNGSWKTTKNLWGVSFFGLPPFLSLAVFIVLLVLFVVWNIFLALQKQASPGMNCRLCKRAICKNCKKGELCISCFRETKFIRNVKTLAAIQAKIVQKREASHRMTEYLLDICLPGSGMLFAKMHSPVIVIIVIGLTSAIYSSYLFVSAIYLTYPLWVVYGNIEKIPYFFGLYNFVFVVRALLAAFRKKEPVLV